MVKLKEDIRIRCSRPIDKRDYWVVFKKVDGEMGYNGWSLIGMGPSRNGFVEEDLLARLEFTMKGVGRRMSSRVQDIWFGVHTTDDY